MQGLLSRNWEKFDAKVQGGGRSGRERLDLATEGAGLGGFEPSRITKSMVNLTDGRDDAVDALLGGQVEDGSQGGPDTVERAGADTGEGEVGVGTGLVTEGPFV